MIRSTTLCIGRINGDYHSNLIKVNTVVSTVNSKNSPLFRIFPAKTFESSTVIRIRLCVLRQNDVGGIEEICLPNDRRYVVNNEENRQFCFQHIQRVLRQQVQVETVWKHGLEKIDPKTVHFDHSTVDSDTGSPSNTVKMNKKSVTKHQMAPDPFTTSSNMRNDTFMN
ncbi:hypothetical protein CLF_111033 [Clonorchis sinensis]|uniref:Uncharacterized protein n=1 Tax=Clonorchis sinensis TaxID=79923 RepID=G7YU81_CLOSI|nr:hypothetical protein CLF_111033 [Clonorchis sinensis]